MKKYVFKLLFFSAFGVFVFFVPVTLGSETTIPLDHIVRFLKNEFPLASKIWALLIITAGAVYPFITGSWKKDFSSGVFSALKAAGLIVALSYFAKLGPQKLFEADLLPFLFDKLVVPVGLIVPVGAVFLAFLVDFGLLELIGTLMEPVMRPLWKTPGRAAIDALASFVGSYSIALLITDKVYVEKKYTAKEAAIIATGFSTVSATFMIIVAKTTGLIGYWNFYFWSTLLITFAVTAVTARIYPLSKKDDDGKQLAKEKNDISIFKRAWTNGLQAAVNSDDVIANVRRNFLDGLKMTMSILPSILSIGLTGLLLAKFTPLFDWLGYVFYPIVKLLALPNAQLVSKAAAVEITEMFLPALLIKNAEFIARYVVAVTSVSAILFFSASIPTILSTRIPLKISELVLIWFERTFLSLIFAAIIGKLFLPVL